MFLSAKRLGIKNDYGGEVEQQFTWPDETRPDATLNFL
jgi:hypothetical protein